jgi:methionyl-tRNA formyltransferase
MKIVFFGTPEYVIPVLSALTKTFGKGIEGVVAVVTKPPKPAGRGQAMERSEVDHWAFKKKIPLLFDPADVPEADLGVVAAFGKIIPENVIKRFKNGILNIHPSLLPKYRGASPIQAAIAAGEVETGVTIIKMDAQMDHGPVVSSFKQRIEDENTQELRRKLFKRSAEFLINLIPPYLQGKTTAKSQNHDEASFTKILTKQDAYLEFSRVSKAQRGDGAEAVHNFIRAMYPWPTAWSQLKMGKKVKRIKLLSSHLEDGKLILEAVQLESKNPVSWNQFKRGYQDTSLDLS